MRTKNDPRRIKQYRRVRRSAFRTAASATTGNSTNSVSLHSTEAEKQAPLAAKTQSRRRGVKASTSEASTNVTPGLSIRTSRWKYNASGDSANNATAAAAKIRPIPRRRAKDVQQHAAHDREQGHELAPDGDGVEGRPEEARDRGPERHEQPGERRMPVAVRVVRQRAAWHGPGVRDVGALVEEGGRPMREVGQLHPGHEREQQRQSRRDRHARHERNSDR